MVRLRRPLRLPRRRVLLLQRERVRRLRRRVGERRHLLLRQLAHEQMRVLRLLRVQTMVQLLRGSRVLGDVMGTNRGEVVVLRRLCRRRKRLMVVARMRLRRRDRLRLRRGRLRRLSKRRLLLQMRVLVRLAEAVVRRHPLVEIIGDRIQLLPARDRPPERLVVPPQLARMSDRRRLRVLRMLLLLLGRVVLLVGLLPLRHQQPVVRRLRVRARRLIEEPVRAVRRRRMPARVVAGRLLQHREPARLVQVVREALVTQRVVRPRRNRGRRRRRREARVGPRQREARRVAAGRRRRRLPVREAGVLLHGVRGDVCACVRARVT